MKRRLLPPAALAVGVDALWAAAAHQAPGLDRADPATWLDAGGARPRRALKLLAFRLAAAPRAQGKAYDTACA